MRNILPNESVYIVIQLREIQKPGRSLIRTKFAAAAFVVRGDLALVAWPA
jgi:hypothetical protein